jgi:hypothetical protein
MLDVGPYSLSPQGKKLPIRGVSSNNLFRRTSEERKQNEGSRLLLEQINVAHDLSGIGGDCDGHAFLCLTPAAAQSQGGNAVYNSSGNRSACS